MSSIKGDPQLSEIALRLDTLIRLSALNIIKDMKSQKKQIEVLFDAGLGPSQIATTIGTTTNTVNVTLSMIRKQRSGKGSPETG
ncbi:MAG: hypothetical protein WED05_08970 [Candidatus Atabeyarchaeum deiterrae]